MGSQLRVVEQEESSKLSKLDIFLLFLVENKETPSFKRMMHFLGSFMISLVVLSSTETAECSPIDKNLDDLKSLHDQSRGDNSGWIDGKCCASLGDSSFTVNEENGGTLKDLATAKKDCVEACEKNLSGELVYSNETCKYASLFFLPKYQTCWLSSSQGCDGGKEIEDCEHYLLYTKL